MALLIVSLLAFCGETLVGGTSVEPSRAEYKFNTTWDNQLSPQNASVSLSLVQETEFLRVKVGGPFFDDPKLPAGTPAGSVDGLWNYEVVELFLLGADEEYLEVELGPRGHYLLYFLQGVRNVTKKELQLDSYVARISADGKRWEGEALIPVAYLPPAMSKFNAYAIHGSEPNRIYMSLFPVPKDKYPGPDFHRLEYFQSLSW